MSNVNDAPQHDDLKGDTWVKTEEERESILLTLSRMGLIIKSLRVWADDFSVM